MRVQMLRARSVYRTSLPMTPPEKQSPHYR